MRKIAFYNNMSANSLQTAFICVLLASALFLIAADALADETAVSDIEVRISGKRLSKDLTISNPSTNDVGLLLRSGFLLTNISKNQYALEYKAEWYDDYGRMTNTGVWQPFQLSPNLSKDIISISKTQGSIKLLVSIRLINGSSQAGKYVNKTFTSNK